MNALAAYVANTHLPAVSDHLSQLVSLSLRVVVEQAPGALAAQQSAKRESSPKLSFSASALLSSSPLDLSPTSSKENSSFPESFKVLNAGHNRTVRVWVSSWRIRVRSWRPL